ncbi:MAG TPA: hypothetical protein VFQ36_24660 [Ktedonobacteraceae bacterium]|nr:hypothetical protein [Ktedonobacteraceae bacterium]
MGVTVDGPGSIPLLPLNSADLKALTNALNGYLVYLQLVHLLAKGEGPLLFSVQELKALKEAAHGFVILMTCILPPSGGRDGVIESLQALSQQFAHMLSPFVN